jgi:teichuronic acid biosynthesis glycosyltransferase TuaC
VERRLRADLIGMRIVFITGNYPISQQSSSGTFVQQFVWAVARQGHECFVIRPTSVLGLRSADFPPPRFEEPVGNATVEVHCPRVLTLTTRRVLCLNPVHIAQAAHTWLCLRAVRSLRKKPDIIYGHFLSEAGVSAVAIAKVMSVPSVIGVGESDFWSIRPYGLKTAREIFRDADGMIAVSELNRHRLQRVLKIAEEKILMAPNGIDPTRFYPIERETARSSMGFPLSDFVVCFVGSNEERKGANRLFRAIQGTGVRGIFIGDDFNQISGNTVLFRGRIPHHTVLWYLNCANLFVLPTTNEGSCNAVLEAMGCGLPVITSNGEYMDDIVDDQMALRVDPNDVNAIRKAILILRDDAERMESMAKASLKKSREHDINVRATKIVNWMGCLAPKRNT